MIASNSAYFGVGCFVFVVDKFENISDWFARIEDALGSIGSIDDLVVSKDVESMFGGVLSLVGSDGEVEGCFQPTDGRIQFRINIPRRLHEKLGSWGDVDDTEAVTEFNVDVRFEYHGPVVFVQSVDAPSSSYPSPSAGVILVREYLSKELEKLAMGVTFQTIGPSPFHVEFETSVHPKEDMPENWPGPMAVIKHPGYDLFRATFYGDFKIENALEFTQDFLADELALFYDLTRVVLIRSMKLDLVRGSLEELIKFHQNRGVRALFSRVFRTSQRARRLLVDVLESEIEEVRAKQFGEEAIREQFSATNKSPQFAEKLRDVQELSYLEELRAIRESVSTLDSGRANDFEVFIISASTILGGIAGAVAALIAS